MIGYASYIGRKNYTNCLSSYKKSQISPEFNACYNFSMLPPSLIDLIDRAAAARGDLFDPEHLGAMRLFNGFYEGCPEMVIDLFGRTLVILDYTPNAAGLPFEDLQNHLRAAFPWVNCILHKQRNAQDPALRRGTLRYGSLPATQIRENGLTYALDLTLNQDTSFYLDTRLLRHWLFENASGWQVLNTFAYTGSLGVAALAGGAERVIQTDRNKNFLALGRQSGALNRLDIGKMKLRANDFFSEIARLKRAQTRFDCVIVDPPFFSQTNKGAVDLVNQSVRVINKTRPLIKDGGVLIAINNALFLSGAAYIASLEALCQDGYLQIERVIPIPMEITGYSETIVGAPPTNPAPFNHATKIAVLRVRRK